MVAKASGANEPQDRRSRRTSWMQEIVKKDAKEKWEWKEEDTNEELDVGIVVNMDVNSASCGR